MRNRDQHGPTDDRITLDGGQQLFRALIDQTPDVTEGDCLMVIRDFLVLRKLGSGGSGDVYFAVRQQSGQAVALKLYHDQVGRKSSLDRAWRELETLTQMRTTHAPRVCEYGLHEGRLFVATDYVEGLSLEEHCQGNDLDLRGRVRLLVALCRSIESLHEHGYIHRDLKPSNVIIDVYGRPVVIDFGIARPIDADAAAPAPAAGQGSPAFMAPEQARGDAAISTRTDLFGLGATACKLLTGESPHRLSGSAESCIERIGAEAPRDVATVDPTIPGTLAAVLNRSLAFDPADRYGSARDFGDDLQRWLDDVPIQWTNPPRRERVRYAIRKNPKAAIAAAVAVLACSGALLFAGVALNQAAYAAEVEDLAEGWETLARQKEQDQLVLLEAERGHLEAFQTMEAMTMQFIHDADHAGIAASMYAVATMIDEGLADDDAPRRYLELVHQAATATEGVDDGNTD